MSIILLLFFITLNSELPISVVIPSYNNKNYYKKNLDSIFQQDYPNYNYKIVYINDCSTDHTGELAQIYLEENSPVPFKLINHTNNRKASISRWHGVNLCEDNDIVVLVDGDDWLADKDVLKKINKAYEFEGIWHTYGSYKTSQDTIPSVGYQMPKSVYQKNKFREYGFVSTHLRTFYAWLFKEIPFGNLIFEGKPMVMAGDVAEEFSLLEMANDKTKFMDSILYVYNTETPLNDSKLDPGLQTKIYHSLLKFPKLKQLTQRPEIKSSIKTVPYPSNLNQLIPILINADFISFRKLNEITEQRIISKMNQTKALAFSLDSQKDDSSINIKIETEEFQSWAKPIEKLIIANDLVIDAKQILNELKKMTKQKLSLNKPLKFNNQVILHF